MSRKMMRQRESEGGEEEKERKRGVFVRLARTLSPCILLIVLVYSTICDMHATTTKYQHR